jgi:hypothetical protein
MKCIAKPLIAARPAKIKTVRFIIAFLSNSAKFRRRRDHCRLSVELKPAKLMEGREGIVRAGQRFAVAIVARKEKTFPKKGKRKIKVT